MVQNMNNARGKTHRDYDFSRQPIMSGFPKEFQIKEQQIKVINEDKEFRKRVNRYFYTSFKERLRVDLAYCAARVFGLSKVIGWIKRRRNEM